MNEQVSRDGAASGLEAVYRDHAPALWRAIFALTGGRTAVADDAVAEAFARALRYEGTIRKPVPWIYRTACRLALEELRRGQREIAFDDALWLTEAPAPDCDALVIANALKALSPQQRVALTLHYAEDLPIDEVARRLGTSAVVIRVQLHRGRRRLRRLLGENEEDKS